MSQVFSHTRLEGLVWVGGRDRTGAGYCHHHQHNPLWFLPVTVSAAMGHVWEGAKASGLAAKEMIPIPP